MFCPECPTPEACHQNRDCLMLTRHRLPKPGWYPIYPPAPKPIPPYTQPDPTKRTFKRVPALRPEEV